MAVEGYAQAQKERVYNDFKGPVYLYEKAGFIRTAEENGVVLMRKTL
jgi:hypothetical protein